MCQGTFCVAKKYINCYGAHDLPGLEQLLSSNALLSDWDQNVIGSSEITQLASKAFCDFPQLSVNVQNFTCDGLTAFAELELNFGSGNFLKVVDVISIKNFKIIEIKAYKK